MLGSTTTRVEIYAASIKSLDQKFELGIEMSNMARNGVQHGCQACAF